MSDPVFETAKTDLSWRTICTTEDLVANSGVCALVDGKQVAIFYLPSESERVFAIGNYDPIGKAYVLSRGIVGSIKGELVVASPLYKQHFSLRDGHCLEEDISVPAYPVRIDGKAVQVAI